MDVTVGEVADRQEPGDIAAVDRQEDESGNLGELDCWIVGRRPEFETVAPRREVVYIRHR
jgi:hypothetical protein